MLRRISLIQNKNNWKKIFLRTFLSDEFKCTSEWQSRLSAPFMQKLKLDTYYFDIEQNFQSYGKTSAIDIDLFANKITPEDDIHLDELNILLHKIRLTDETTNVLASTSHAAVRNFADAGHISDLIHILDNRLDYGVFLDDFTASYLLDTLIKQRNFVAAARVASYLMLQEDLGNELSKSLALYACYKYLDNAEEFVQQTAAEENSEEKKEEVKVRVKYLRNEYFDDHFDLKNRFHIVGKTFIEIATNLNNEMKDSVNFLGHFYYEKYDKCLELLKTHKNQLHKDVIEKCMKHSESITGADEKAESNEHLNKITALLSKSLSDSKSESVFLETLEKYVNEVVSKQEKVEAQKQKSLYEEWNKLREVKLNEEIERLNRAKRIKEVERLRKEMESEEQKLWFFENEDKLELQTDSKRVFYPKKWFGKKKKPRVVDEGYVPPEIVKARK